MNGIDADLGHWSALVAQRLAAPDEAARADHLLTQADTAALAEMREAQARNRHASYERRRPARYAAASYATLRPEQDPRGMVSGWWRRGPLVLVLAGPSRTGKTTAAYAIGNDAHQQHAWVVTWTAADLSAALKPDGEDTAYGHAAACDLLLIDDLGRERVTDWWREQLHRIVDRRTADARRLVVTANVTPDPERAYDELVDRYGDPIAERLVDDGGMIVFDGPALRSVVSEW